MTADGSHRDALPDVAHERPRAAGALDWVGMCGIAMPVALDDADAAPARVDIAVDLAAPDRRGIHMSRLHRLVDAELSARPLTPSRLRAVLDAAITSQDGIARAARVRIATERLAERAALVSDERSWRGYPVRIEALGNGAAARLTMAVEVLYSSTCPASAALSRQLIAAAIAERLAGGMDARALGDWIAEGGLVATPHAQRSTATVSVELSGHASRFEPIALVDRIEAALGTPVQTRVRRIDEQAFARRNAENLMFCEDAARRLAAALAADGRWPAWHVRVVHHESLHAHDASAEASHRWRG
jgi:GTP cyclohydrolase I